MLPGDDLFPEREPCSLSRKLWPIFCGFDGSLGFAVLWTGAGLGLVDSLALTKRSAYGRMRRRRLEADGDALEMLSIVHCGCPRTEGAPIWSQAQKRSSGSGCRGRVDEGKTWTRVSQHRGRPAASLSKVGLLLVGYLMQCHEAYQAPNQHRREEGRRPSNLPGTCQLGRMPRMQSPGGGGSWSSGEVRGLPNGSALLHTFLWFRDTTKCDEMAADSGLGMWSPAMLEKTTGRKEWATLSGRWDSDVQIWQMADW
ncbi:hypothetical protein QBC45DRAFT_455461 [Copromyces sp. CBS 386.78]|nr:hypothetical protein QBC45DRAFT_455461 [Copromyces sp. CBS 386.78]